MDWSMRDDAFKVEMFRFVDVFPVLASASEVARHLQEYFCRPGQDFPKALQWGLSAVKPTSRVAKLAARQIEKNISEMAERFIAGRDALDAMEQLEGLRASGVGFTVDLLGEACVSEAEALIYQRRYVDMIEALTERTRGWTDDARVEGARFPRVNISIKPSALYSQLDPIAPEASAAALVERLRPILRVAAERGVTVNLDLERYARKDLTYDVVERIVTDPTLRQGLSLGCVVQAYLRDSERDLRRLIKLSKKHHRLTVRLVKGAYWDYETIHAEQEGWPAPVFIDKAETDANFEHLCALLLDAAKHITPAIASHNVRSIAAVLATAERQRLSRDDFEFQMLYGMAEPLKEAITGGGWRLRDYVPVGELVPGMAYLVRRLLENTSNESWLRKGFVEQQSTAALLEDPQTVAKRAVAAHAPVFRNEPLLDFSRVEARASVAQALRKLKKRLPLSAAPGIGGDTVTGTASMSRYNPAKHDELLGVFTTASVEQADAAVALAKEAFGSWREVSVRERAGVLRRVASGLRRDRAEVVALIVLEVGKGWRGADADLCEAIDFLELYAQEMERMEAPRRMGRLPGELNHYFYEPRGVCAVIAPWNFPLAILTGMVSAALVSGNTVVMKPAEQSTLVAAELWRRFVKAGIPRGVLAFLPGRGEVIGAHLVAHPDVSTIAFTGSQEVGLAIYEQAGITHPSQRHLKRVICELGGKNAIIVDGDADLDEAVLGVIHSAFAFQGQKCSACSRAIVLEAQYDVFVERLCAALTSMQMGAPEDPQNTLGPVVDAEARDKILDYIRLGGVEGEIAAQLSAPTGGHYVPATIITNVSPQSRVAQEEIFGPVLCVLRAGDFEEALGLAMATPYALTGALYSRSPSNIARAREAFRVGNLYINRGSTGALVWRQPFGGAARSGVGSKAGGPDYLLQFMVPRVITENTMRRGFAPSEE